MPNETFILMATALSIGFFHTLFGPDHYLPFIAMAKARNWSFAKTFFITLLCGLGHILSSVVLGLIGIIFGINVFKLGVIESARGGVAAWLLLIFGFTYFVWGLHRAALNKPHSHRHQHEAKKFHEHHHDHACGHSHLHEAKEKANITPWILFTIFIFGPCEPLIPLLMYPAAKGSVASVIAVTAVFGFVTLFTMLGLVFMLLYGLLKLPLGQIERYSHAFAGLIIFLCGGAIKFLGL